MTAPALLAADPDALYPGLPDGEAYTVAAVVDAARAGSLVPIVASLRDAGCPSPASADAIRSWITTAEIAVDSLPDTTAALVADAAAEATRLLARRGAR